LILEYVYFALEAVTDGCFFICKMGVAMISEPHGLNVIRYEIGFYKLCVITHTLTIIIFIV
jgi:hypothetical protein